MNREYVCPFVGKRWMLRMVQMCRRGCCTERLEAARE